MSIVIYELGPGKDSWYGTNFPCGFMFVPRSKLNYLTNCYDWLSLVAVYECIISTYILLVHTALVLTITIRSYCISIPCCMCTYRYVIIVIVTVQHMHVYTIIVIATC